MYLSTIFFHNVYVIEEHKAHVVNVKNKIIYIYIYIYIYIGSHFSHANIWQTHP
jgi:hypothetical protein